MGMEDSFETVVIEVEPQDYDYETSERSTRKDAEEVVESLHTVETECEEAGLDDDSLRDIMADIEAVNEFDISEMEVNEIKMEVQDDIELIESDMYRDSVLSESDRLKMEIQDDIEKIERNEDQNGISGENEDGLCAELANIDENGIVELVEKDILDLARNNVSKQIRNTVDINEEKNYCYHEDATYFCILCEQSVEGGSAAKTHFLEHIEEENYNCMACDTVYSSNCFNFKHCLVQYQVIGETFQGELYKYYSVSQLLRNENLNIVQNSDNNIKEVETGVIKEVKDKSSVSSVSKQPGHLSGTAKDSGLLKQERMIANATVQSAVRSHIAVGRFVCLDCLQSFALVDDLKAHCVNEHNNHNMYMCPNCNKTFSADKNLKSHLKTHNETGCQIHICTICYKMFKKADQIRTHMFTHTGHGSFKCEDCGKLCKSRSILMRHRQSHSTEKEYLCTICNKLLASASSLKSHMYVHTGEQTYPCTECNKVYTKKRFLKEHMCTHTGEGDYVCSICSKKYYSSRQLKIHMCKHTGERPYVCDVCNESFLLRSSLTRHMFKHTGIKPFSCKTCEKKFILNKDLQEHLKIHSFRPFQCNLCARRFTTGAYLRRHKKQHDRIEGEIFDSDLVKYLAQL